MAVAAAGQKQVPQAVREEAIYFPAQKIHFELDDPRSAADVILTNDPRLGG